ncbi:hypothetical protein ASG89_21935 [Paenibacillus sp. Soil766]|nr:hypothetical protein ASG89_21935 [Paenibacillus sp. Soil766]
MFLFVIFFTFNTVTQAATYTYDELNRLISVTYENGATINYTYDPAGNLLSATKSGLAPVWPQNAALTYSNLGQISLTLNWPAATDDSGEVNYAVYNGSTLLAMVNDSSYEVTGLAPGTGYTFSVVAKDLSGNASSALTVAVTTIKSSSGTTPAGAVGGGSSGPPASTSSGAQVTADKNGNVDSSILKAALSTASNVTISTSGTSISMPAAALSDASKAGGSVTVTSGTWSYTLPLAVLTLDALAKDLGVSTADLTIKITVQKPTGDSVKFVTAAASRTGLTIFADPIDFRVEAVSKDGKSETVAFGKTYVSRTVILSVIQDFSKFTGVMYDETTKTLVFVPTFFETKNGSTIATFKRNGNSIYTVVQNNKTFDDIQNHWAKADIELLANKLIVDGVSSHTFDADRSISRAEFAALVVRALGLTSSVASNGFKDVASTAWYAQAVATAVNAGLVNGYEDGAFRPDASITREELTAMMIRAINYTGTTTAVSADEQSTLLGQYQDAKSINWAQAEMAAAVQAGLISGMTDATIDPSGQATRAQAVTMLKRMLTAVKFIN